MCAHHALHSAHLNRSSSRAKVADAASGEGEPLGIAHAPASFKCDVWKHLGFCLGDEKGSKVTDRQETMLLDWNWNTPTALFCTCVNVQSSVRFIINANCTFSKSLSAFFQNNIPILQISYVRLNKVLSELLGTFSTTNLFINWFGHSMMG